jgi:6-phosphofructokinase
MAKKRIGILTGGGDVPGLNLAIKQVVLNAEAEGVEVIGIRRGWGGLLHYDIDDKASQEKNTLKLDSKVVRKVDRSGGTFLHTSRTNPGRVRPKDIPEFLANSEKGSEIGDDGSKDYTDHILQVLDHIGIESLISIGGDDTLSYSARLHKEKFPIVAIPKTMDNDVYGTDYCIGFSTSVTSSLRLISNFRTSLGSHERVGIVELFGRNSGETALITGYLSYADRALICEVPFNSKKVAELITKDKKNNPSNYALILVSEGAIMDDGEVVQTGEADAYGHRKLGGIGELLNDQIKKLTGFNTMYQKLGYLMRSGPADVVDRMVGMNFGNLAWELTKNGDFGKMTAINNGRYNAVDVEGIIHNKRHVDVDRFYDVDEYRPRIQNIAGLPLFLE